MDDAARRDEVTRILGRYLVEVVERWDMCPWARSAREGGEVAIDVVWGTPSEDAWVAAAAALLARPATRVAMVVAPQLEVDASTLHGIRDVVARRIPTAGIAEFHPHAPLDLATPPRLVPFVRRSPDPLLQLVPLALLDAVRVPPPIAARAQQAQVLAGLHAPPVRDIAARIASTNHATVSAHQAEIIAVLDDISRDRATSYARVGISTSR